MSLWGIVLPTLAASAALVGELTAQACIGTPIPDGAFAATVEKLIGDRLERGSLATYRQSAVEGASPRHASRSVWASGARCGHRNSATWN
jgi:hypothetical protein